MQDRILSFVTSTRTLTQEELDKVAGGAEQLSRSLCRR